MYLNEYLKLRGVNANALTQPEAQLLQIDTSGKGWVADFAHIEIPDALAALALRTPGVAVLKAKAKEMLRNTPVAKDFASNVDAGKGAQLLAIVRAFIEKQRIYCPETIHQTDRVIENAYGLIEDLVDVVGYLEDDEE